MIFSDAISKIIKTENSARFGNPFYLYSRLCDMCCESEDDRKKCDAFFEIDKAFHIIESIKTKGIGAYTEIKKSYSKLEGRLDEELFLNVVDAVAYVIDFRYVVRDSKEYKNKRDKIIAVSVAAPLVIAGIVCLIVFRNFISWVGWQFVIGIVGALVLSVLGIFVIGVAYGFKTSNTALEIAGLIYCVVLAAVNTALYYALREEYNVIYYWVTGAALVICALCIEDAFSENVKETECGIATIVTAVFILASLVIAIVYNAKGYYLEWTVCQHLIGAIGGLFFVGMCVYSFIWLFLNDRQNEAYAVAMVCCFVVETVLFAVDTAATFTGIDVGVISNWGIALAVIAIVAPIGFAYWRKNKIPRYFIVFQAVLFGVLLLAAIILGIASCNMAA